MTETTKTAEPLYSDLGSDPDLAELVEMFVEELPDRVALVLDQLDASDWEGLRRTAHQLRGAAGSYGFSPISASAGRLEQALSEEEPEAKIRDTADAVIGICRRARAGTPA